jgi:predicted RND superfamily exporter protein
VKYLAFTSRVDRSPHRALALLALAMVPALYLTVLFFGDVRSGLEELLPSSAPSVRALEKIHARLGGKSHLTIIADSPDPAANRRFIDELTERLRAKKIPEARSIQGDCKVERKWLLDHGPLLLPDERFEPLADDLEEAIDRAKASANPFFVDLEDKRDPTKLFADFEKQLEGDDDRFPNGYFETKDGKRVVLMIWLEGSEVDLEPSLSLLQAAMREVDAIRAQYPPSMVVAYNGEVPNLVEEHAAILADLSLSSMIVFVLVAFLIVVYYRSLRAVLVVVLGLIPGLIFTFAIGRLTVGHLNSNTAFLGSIIAGNGINYPLIFLAYYRTRSPHENRALAIAHAGRCALPGTLGAAATASAAYGGLAAATFRGFSQFGWLGAVGMLTTWFFTFVAAPIGIALFDPPRQGERPTKPQAVLLRYFGHRHLPRMVALSATLLMLFGSALGVRYAIDHGLYEMDLQTLRNRDSLASGSASWDGKMNELFGVWLNPIVALANDPSDREPVATELRKKIIDPKGSKVEPGAAERVETIEGLVPTLDVQTARIARMNMIADRLQKIPREKVPPKAREMIDRWLAPENLHTITVADVPESLVQGFKEVDGRTDRVVLVYPSLAINYNDGRNILRFADRLATAHVPDKTVVGGGFLFMGEIIRLVRDEAPRVVLVVSALVALVLLPFFARRPLRIPLVVAAIAAVAICAQAIMLALGVQLNMLNFAAVPITIGVGSDYAVNLLGAMDAFRVDARRACARMGGGILLCSLTTIVGYVSLVIAQSGALRTFGWAAVLGEAMAVTTVLLVLPVVLAEQPGRAVNPCPRD